MKRLWMPQEMTATRQCQNGTNNLIHRGGGGGGEEDDDDDCKHA